MWVQIEHPDVPGQVGRVTADAFRLVWEPKGWRQVGYNPPEPPAPEPADDDDTEE